MNQQSEQKNDRYNKTKALDASQTLQLDSVNEENDTKKQSRQDNPSKTAHDGIEGDEKVIKNIVKQEGIGLGYNSSPSSTSGVVSPSSCSSSSGDDECAKPKHELEEESNCTPIVPSDPSKIKSANIGISSTFKDVKDSTISKVKRNDAFEENISGRNRMQIQRPLPRKRSNSVPSYAHSSATSLTATSLTATSLTATSLTATSSTSVATITSGSKGRRLRRGKWTVEEEAYVARVIQDFNNGFLNAPAGTTLRTYLSDKLNCDPMRITKKFTGDSCIGKRVFHPAVRCTSNASSIDKAQSELDCLERRWRRRLEMQKRDAEKKQAASVAATAASVAAAAANAPHLHDPTSALIRLNASALPGNRVVVTRTASWLDRANAILSKRRNAIENQANKGGNRDSVKKEMQEVERLIQEVPIIQQSSGLLLQKYSNETTSKRGISDNQEAMHNLSSSSIPGKKPSAQSGQQKRMRKSLSVGNLEEASFSKIRHDFNLSSGEAEDAASFIGFISSLRNEAASGSGSK